jgi:orotidine-5'-phosphate decarboxylase
MKTSPIIVALDFEAPEKACSLVCALGDTAGFYKVGLELYAAAGMDFVRELKREGHRVFLDLKLYDIGETVKRAVARIAEGGVDFLTIHAVRQTMAAAVAGKESASQELKLLGVTVLTSFDDSDLKDMGYALNVSELVDLRVRQALETGMDGLVCSPLEVSRVRSIAGPAAILVTPGVRSRGSDSGDQKRVATPAQALAAGADYLVIGRQVTRAADPRSELQKILAEIS